MGGLCPLASPSLPPCFFLMNCDKKIYPPLSLADRANIKSGYNGLAGTHREEKLLQCGSSCKEMTHL